jgi:hypothetical protein
MEEFYDLKNNIEQALTLASGKYKAKKEIIYFLESQVTPFIKADYKSISQDMIEL